MSPEMREHVAENMKERIYATITLIAVMVALWQTARHHTVVGSIATIVGTVTALWLATLMSARMSHRVVHNKSMSARSHAQLMFASSGLFMPAITPVLFLGLSGAGVLPLRGALFAGIVALVLSLFILSFVATRRIYPSYSKALVISLLEMMVGVGVIALKLAVGE